MLPSLFTAKLPHFVYEYFILFQRLCQSPFLKKLEEIQASELDEMVEKTFEGSLPAFIAAFSKSENLTEDDVTELLRLIKEKKEKK